MNRCDNQSVLVLSDLHLPAKFSSSKYELLCELISGCDRVIINGDLFEGFDISLKEFVESEWKKLFSLLKQKEVVYIVGNHDPLHEQTDMYNEISSHVTRRYEMEQSGTKFLIMHGDLFDETLDLRHPNLPRWLLSLGSRFERLMVSIFGRNFLRLYFKSNQRMKKWRLANMDNNTWLICGHSHMPEVDLKNRYANSGIFLKKGRASYLTIANGEVKLTYV